MIQELKKTIEQQRAQLLEIGQGRDLQRTPEGSNWNGAQCIMHMCLATELYLNQIEKKLHLLKPAKGQYKQGFWAKKFTKGLSPDENGKIRNKMKTMKVFEPEDVDSNEAVSRLTEDLDRTLQVLEKLEGKDLRSFKVTSALGPILKFYVGDALRFVNGHNARHFVQLENITREFKLASVPS